MICEYRTPVLLMRENLLQVFFLLRVHLHLHRVWRYVSFKRNHSYGYVVYMAGNLLVNILNEHSLLIIIVSIHTAWLGRYRNEGFRIRLHGELSSYRIVRC